MEESFGHWLAGFTDGEGYFTISRATSRNGNPHNKTWPTCHYGISLRMDDYEILCMIRDTLGFGRLYTRSGNKSRPNEKPSAKFVVHRIGDCGRLVELFTRYPLLAKKRAQFAVWADAVREMTRGRERDDAFIDACRAQLADLRQYIDPGVLETLSAENPPMLRHRRDYGAPPLCQCGCGQPTKLVTNSGHLAHPENANYCSFLRGHHARVRPVQAHVNWGQAPG